MNRVLPLPAGFAHLVAQVLAVEDESVTPDTRFVDLGRTSLQEVELITAIEDRYQVSLDYVAFVEMRTVGDLCDAVAAATGRTEL